MTEELLVDLKAAADLISRAAKHLQSWERLHPQRATQNIMELSQLRNRTQSLSANLDIFLAKLREETGDAQ